MNKLFLTIDIDVNDSVLNNNELKNVSKINYGDIVDKRQPKFNTPEELFDLRIELLLMEVSESSNDLLIGFAITELEHLIDLNKSLNKTNFKITEIFLDNGSRKQEKAEKYEKEYRLHARWLGYTPKEVNQMNDEFYDKIEALLIEAKKKNIICTKV